MTSKHPYTEEDTRLLNMYLSPGVALLAICEELDINFSELERRLNQTHISQAIERATRMHEQRARTLARCQSEDAVATLHHIAQHPDHNPETRRKAATKIISMATAHGSKRTGRPTSTPRQRSTPRATSQAPSPIGRAGRGQGKGSPTAPPPPARFTNSNDITHQPAAHQRGVTGAPSPAVETPDTRTYTLHPFTHPHPRPP